ncbi:MAG: hypothetical protein ACREUQ_01470 [Burkholderiales bacterium]
MKVKISTLLTLALAAHMTVVMAKDGTNKDIRPMKLPTEGGKLAAEAAGQFPLQIAPMAERKDGGEEAEAAATPDAKPSAARLRLPAPGENWQPGTWRVRGTLTQDEYVFRRDYVGNPLDVWGLESWRFDAAVTKDF